MPTVAPCFNTYQQTVEQTPSPSKENHSEQKPISVLERTPIFWEVNSPAVENLVRGAVEGAGGGGGGGVAACGGRGGASGPGARLRAV